MTANMEIDVNELLKLAENAKSFSYSPYSGFKVGAALISENGRIYTGTNIENASFGATCCAERTAVFKAVSEGELIIKAIAIVSDKKDYIYPCGICRQVLAEFGDKDTLVICSGGFSYEIHKLSELLPYAFELNQEEVL
jgi:cytidine deaminase